MSKQDAKELPKRPTCARCGRLFSVGDLILYNDEMNRFYHYDREQCDPESFDVEKAFAVHAESVGLKGNSYYRQSRFPVFFDGWHARDAEVAALKDRLAKLEQNDG